MRIKISQIRLELSKISDTYGQIIQIESDLFVRYPTCMESGVRQSEGSSEIILTVLSARPTARNLRKTDRMNWRH